MTVKTSGLSVITIGFASLLFALPASAQAFQPMKYMQDASTAAALVAAISQMSSCEENLTFSEETTKAEDGSVITVTVACAKFPEDDGKTRAATAKVEFELNEDGTVGSPLGYNYD
ncbi:MAG: hypothetical protein AAF732_02065 [Pseudomonadota bacterium]